MLIYLLFVPMVLNKWFSVFHASGRGKKKGPIGRSAYPSFLRCKVIVGHSFKENIYKFNICNYLLWKDILKPNVIADKGSGWTVV